MVPRWAIPPPFPIPMLSLQSTTCVIRPIDMSLVPLEDDRAPAPLCPGVCHPEHSLVLNRTVLRIIRGRHLGLHELALLQGVREVGKDLVAHLPDDGNGVRVLQLEDDGSYLDLELELLAPDVDDLPARVGIWEPPSRPFGNGGREAGPVQGHPPHH